MDEALAAAARLAELDDYNLISYPKIEPEFDDLLSAMGPFGAIDDILLKQYPEEIRAFLTTLSTEAKRPNIEARLPYSVEIK